MIKVKNAYEAFASLLNLVEQSRPRRKGIHPSAVIEGGAEIGNDVYIGANAYIGEKCKIGDGSRIYPQVYIGENTRVGTNCLFFPGVKIYHDCIIGNNCTIHAGTVIGSDGFGFAPQSESEFMKIPQIGNVIIEDNVEIGANAAIDRATMGSTIIRKGVKLDNLIQVGHNVEIGNNTVMAGQAGVAGSAKIGKNCMIGGQVGFAGHIKVADGIKIGAQAGIAGDLKEENVVLIGSPAIDARNYMKSYAMFKKLPEIKSRIDQIEKEIDALKKR
jgi:UDP-3-O-[3-hydroxymyristoyl] glucosamine N-acyltransferase